MSEDRQAFNPYLPLNEYIPDGEPHVFGDRVYIFGSHDREGGTTYCELDYTVYSAPVTDLTDWRCEGTVYRAEQDLLSVLLPGGAGREERIRRTDLCGGV